MEESKIAQYLRTQLTPEQSQILGEVQQHLGVPRPRPTQEEIEEAQNAECR